jgi:hypothetical protein
MIRIVWLAASWAEAGGAAKKVASRTNAADAK